MTLDIKGELEKNSLKIYCSNIINKQTNIKNIEQPVMEPALALSINSIHEPQNYFRKRKKYALEFYNILYIDCNSRPYIW